MNYRLLSFVALFDALTADAAKKNVVLTFQFVNGTWQHVVERQEAESDGKLFKVIFLVLIFLAAFVANALLVSTVVSSLSLKRQPFNLLLMHVGVAGLVECVCNVALSVAYVVVEEWLFGYWICYINSFFMEWIPIACTTFYVALAADRALATKDPVRYKRTGGSQNSVRVRLLIAGLWLFSAASAIVVAIGLVESWPFTWRYSCQVMHEWSLAYGAATALHPSWDYV